MTLPVLTEVAEEVAEKGPTFAEQLNSNVGVTIFWCAVGLVGLGIIGYVGSRLFGKKKGRR